MKRLQFLAVLALIFSITAMGQEEKKSKFNIKKPNLNIGEKVGTLTGKLMTGSTDVLEGVVAKTSIVSGVYPTEIKTTESKFYPPGTIEGDYAVAITFMKGSGMGMYKIEGKVLCDGEEMEYVSLGSYMKTYRTPFVEPKTITIETSKGDKASLVVKPIVHVGIVSVNDEDALPVIDLSEDIKLTFSNPPGSEGTKIKVALLTNVMGVKALNRFATFDAGSEPTVTVTIPKEALSNPEIAGSAMNAGNYNKGDNFLIVERELLTERDKMGQEQQLGKLQTAEIRALSYGSMPVVVKGKQEEGVYGSIKVNQKAENGVGYTFYKPNANTGIPFSKGARFGLATFTLEGKLFKQETNTSERDGYNNTRIITTTTTTYQFPQLPDSYWEYVMEKVYKSLESFLGSTYNISLVPVEKVTVTADYATLFPASDDNSTRIIRTSYKGTQRTNPKSIGEIVGSVSSNITSDNAMVNMMKEADVDGLITLHLQFQVGGNKNGNVVLFPSLTLSINGRDEDNNNKQGTYANGYIVKTTGVPFNAEKVKASPEALAAACSIDELTASLVEGVKLLRAKEIELGYDKIWNIGQ